LGHSSQRKLGRRLLFCFFTRFFLPAWRRQRQSTATGRTMTTPLSKDTQRDQVGTSDERREDRPGEASAEADKSTPTDRASEGSPEATDRPKDRTYQQSTTARMTPKARRNAPKEPRRSIRPPEHTGIRRESAHAQTRTPHSIIRRLNATTNVKPDSTEHHRTRASPTKTRVPRRYETTRRE